MSLKLHKKCLIVATLSVSFYVSNPFHWMADFGHSDLIRSLCLNTINSSRRNMTECKAQ